MSSTTTAVPSVPDLISGAEQTINVVNAILTAPGVQLISAAVPGLPMVEQMLVAMAPHVQDVLQFASAETGKPFGQIFADWVAHGTPGMEIFQVFSKNPTAK